MVKSKEREIKDSMTTLSSLPFYPVCLSPPSLPPPSSSVFPTHHTSSQLLKRHPKLCVCVCVYCRWWEFSQRVLNVVGQC